MPNTEEQFKVGDRVRVVLEGTITWKASHSFHRFELDGLTLINPLNTESIEKAGPPLPTASGSVIRNDSGPLSVLIGGEWVDADGFTSPTIEGYTVLFDAGPVE